MPSRALAIGVVDLLLFFYVLWFRTHGISESFFIYADQIRDWQIALSDVSELPLVGPPSQAGGYTAGPIYYWILWVIARTVGPWVDYLPHAGGIGISLLQSVADVMLFHGLARRLRSGVLAIAIVLAVATAGHDATVSSTIWNPPVAVALTKIALGVTTLVGVDGIGKLIAVASIAWMAVQAHLTALPVTLTLLAFVLIFPRGAQRRGWRDAGQRFAIIGVVMGVLQIPWLVHHLTVSVPSGPAPMAESIVAVLGNPLIARPLESAYALVRALHFNSGFPLSLPIATSMLLLGATALVRLTRDEVLHVIAVGPLLCAVVVFAVWQGPLTENYWYLALSPSAALCLAGWIAATSNRVRPVVGAVMLVLVGLMQPMQAEIAWRSLRTPVYGALVRGARSTLQSGYSVREVKTSFSMPEGTDPAYVYSILGGRLDATATERVVVSASGAITLETVR